MSMTVTGKIIHILPAEAVGTSGKMKQTFVLEMDDRYETKVAFDVWGDKVAIGDGEVNTFYVAPESRESKGKWFTNLTCWKKEAQGSIAPAPATTTPAAVPAAPATKITPTEDQFKVLVAKMEPLNTAEADALIKKFQGAYELTAEQIEALKAAALPF